MNRHIGILFIKKTLFGLLLGLLSFYCFDLIFYHLLHSSNFIKEWIFSHWILSEETIHSIYRSHWDTYCWVMVPLLILYRVAQIIKSIGHNIKYEKVITVTSDIIIEVAPVVFFFIIIYLTGVLNSSNVGEEIYTLTRDENLKHVYRGVAIVLAGVLYFKFAFALLFSEIPVKILEARLNITNSPLFRRMFSFGRGGSADWANIADLIKTRVKLYYDSLNGATTRDIIFGRELYEDSFDPHLNGVPQDNESHIVTIGASGSGKSTTVLNALLASYDGSIIIFDPKGELAYNTFNRRNGVKSTGNDSEVKSIGSDHHAFLLDPFRAANNINFHQNFNPLSLFDVNNRETYPVLDLIVDGLLISSAQPTGSEMHFRDLAKMFIKAILIHVKSHFPEKNHNLSYASELVMGGLIRDYDPNEFGEMNSRLSGKDRLLIQMSGNGVMNNIVSNSASTLLGMGDNERGSVFSTATAALEWAIDPVMKEQITDNLLHYTINDSTQKMESNFWTLRKKTIYIVLPDTSLEAHRRWLRVLFNILIDNEKKIQKPYKTQARTLFVLDEYYQIKDLESVKKGYPFLRSYNIRLWLVFQELSQIKTTIGSDWNSVISSSIINIVGVNDTETESWISEQLGNIKIEDEEGKIKAVPLLTPNEVREKFGKDKLLTLVLNAGKQRRLHKINYMPLEEGISFEDLKINVSFKNHYTEF